MAAPKSNKTAEKPMARRISAPKGKSKATPKKDVLEALNAGKPKETVAPISGCTMITH